MSKKIFIVAGEASGDVLGGSLMGALKEHYGDENVEFAGVGGKFMTEAGLESLIPMEELCVMGITEVLEHMPRLLPQHLRHLNAAANILALLLRRFNFPHHTVWRQ